MSTTFADPLEGIDPEGIEVIHLWADICHEAYRLQEMFLGGIPVGYIGSDYLDAIGDLRWYAIKLADLVFGNEWLPGDDDRMPRPDELGGYLVVREG